MSATVPLRTALEFTDWRGVFLILSGLTLFSALVLWLVYPEKEGSTGPVPMKKQLEGLKTVLTSRPFLAIAPLVMFSQSAQMAIQGLWAKPWIRDVAGLDEAE